MKKYYSTKMIKKPPPKGFSPTRFFIIWGQKDNGKSYSVKDEVFPDFLLNGKPFIFLKRFSDECTQFVVEQNFTDYPIEKVSNGEFTTITAYQHRIWLGVKGDTKQVIAGYYFSLDREQDYAGIQIPNLGSVWMDEWVSRSYYLPNEPYKFLVMLSTLARDGIPKVWLTGNNVSKLNPYIDEWGLQKMIAQKQGTIFHTQVEDANGNLITIAVERCGETGGENSLIIGKDAKHIVKGTDRIKQAPHLPKAYYEYTPFYSFVIERENLRFLVQLMEDKGIGPFLYVQPKTSEIKPKTRVITDNLFIGGELVTYNLHPITQREKIIFDLLYAGKIFYSDNTTARDFANVINSFKQFNPFL